MRLQRFIMNEEKVEKMEEEKVKTEQKIDEQETVEQKIDEIESKEEIKETEIISEGENFTFTTEINKLLEIFIHSLYTQKEIFLRELISNAADALDKVRYKMLTDKTLRDQDLPLEMTLSVNKDKHCIILSDNGIGMTRQELIENLGTIAHSGSSAFISKLAESKESQTDLQLIGQFGVGFYSVFMVAQKVEVCTLSALADSKAYMWTSTGKGEYSIAEIKKEQRGTEIRIYLNDNEFEFLETYRLENIVKKYSDFISYPIILKDEKNATRQINQLSAIWRKSPSEVTQEQYDEYYKYLTHSPETPLAHIHMSYDAPIQFSSILYIPRTLPWDMKYQIPEKWRGIHLYARRVFIQSDCENLLPKHLQFVRGVVDSDDIPLNISRETLQENKIISKIRKNLVRKILDTLSKMAEEKPEDYKTFWNTFGVYLKDGYRLDYENKDKTALLFRFTSSKSEELTSLEDYVSRMKEGQKDIYYISGEDRNAIETSPHLEVFHKKDIEVLYLTDTIDDFLMSDMNEFQGKPFVAIDREDVSLDDIKTEETDKTEEEKQDEEEDTLEISEKNWEDFRNFFQETLKDRVTEVKFSQRLIDSPSCLVSGKNDPNVGMQKLFKLMQADYQMAKRTMEINKKHPLIRRMAKIYADNPRDNILTICCHQLLDNLLILEGSPLDARGMVPRIQELMNRIC